MNETCRLLKKSFYEDEWVLTHGGADIWVRIRDKLKLWGSNGVLFFTGWENNIHIPLFLRPYMKHHLKKGQNLLATKKYLACEITDGVQ